MKRATVVVFLALSGCNGSQVPAIYRQPTAATAVRLFGHSVSPIQHVVIVIQENRSVDNLFHFLPGANTVSYGKNSKGQSVPLQPVLLTGPYDMDHDHSAYLTDYANGKVDDWNFVGEKCKDKTSQCPSQSVAAYAYVPRNEVRPYYDLAERYTFGAAMFQSNQGPSFPAHQYLVSGTSTIVSGSIFRAAENAFTSKGVATGGCNSPKGTIVRLIDPNGKENEGAFPCFSRLALTDLIDTAGLSWHYYQNVTGAGLWNGLDAIEALWKKKREYDANVITRSSQFLTDIGNGYLANVTWITPSSASSDHALHNNGSGPSWVASVVNAIGESKYWNSTAIFVTWDDWGGWYDHVAPKQYNSYELGFRVPLLVISPYAKREYISTVPHEFGSILKFTEETFGLGSMKTTDVRSDNLSDCFQFDKPPHKFKPIPAPFGKQYFLHQISVGLPDD